LLSSDHSFCFLQTPIFWAAERGKAEVVELLMDLPGINLSVKNEEGQSLWDVSITKECKWLIDQKTAELEKESLEKNNVNIM